LAARRDVARAVLERILWLRPGHARQLADRGRLTRSSRHAEPEPTGKGRQRQAERGRHAQARPVPPLVVQRIAQPAQLLPGLLQLQPRELGDLGLPVALVPRRGVTAARSA
jgi:hypothetical protein